MEAAAAEWAALRSELMVAKSAAAAVISSGAALTNDMSVHLTNKPSFCPPGQDETSLERDLGRLVAFRRKRVTPDPGGRVGPSALQTSPEASNTQLTSPDARFSKWFGGAKATRLFMSQ
ncbi:hypothetical protein MCNS_27470 [Mycobacterium conspicuum]|uniref:Uncharacterized protein n=1 Tax=Mycobacterium conspicuum TaxID=44010 RepID=A0A7I7YEK5_9MYCO|nr:hypothetical protein MCNS_27470 [Mycobacterium conspicuum]